MNLTFKYETKKMLRKKTVEWILLDDKIIFEDRIISLSSIDALEHHKGPSGGAIFIRFGSDFKYLFYDESQRNDAEEAAKYILNYNAKKIENIQEIKEKGYRKRCNICGKIICYTLEDLGKNALLDSTARFAIDNNFINTISTNRINHQIAASQLNQVIDYKKCPNCGSRDLVDITDEDIAKKNTQNSVQTVTSCADELKKFKELLDMGVITQEEFDAKKKQLLGL